MRRARTETVSYGGWENCVRLSNGVVDLVVTVDVGPRIIRYGFTGRENELCEVRSMLGLRGGDEWRIYGGHRLWHGPEDSIRTYVPDNSPVKWEEVPQGIRTIQDTEAATGIKKEMEISLFPEGSRVGILHRLTNTGAVPVELSAWSISAMAPGGKEVIPLAAAGTGLLPDRVMVLWPYTRLDDPRLRFLEGFIVLQHDPGMKQPVKLGTSIEDGWAAYFNHDHLFVKYYRHFSGARYADLGASYETYANDYMLEMETLSPSSLLEPGGQVEHYEAWELFDNVRPPLDDEAEIRGLLADRIHPLRA